MAFVDEDDVIECMEAVMGAVFERERFDVPPPPWPRMTFAEAVSRFGIDRPDTRFGLELHDLGDALARHRVQGVRRRARRRAAWCAGSTPAPRELPRSELDALTELAKQHGAKGLVWAFVQDGRAGARRSPSSSPRPRSPRSTSGSTPSRGDLLLIVADEVTTVGQALSALRLELARRFDLIPAGRHDILWVVEFPAFFWDAERAALGRRAPPVHRAVGRPRRSRRT